MGRAVSEALGDLRDFHQALAQGGEPPRREA